MHGASKKNKMKTVIFFYFKEQTENIIVYTNIYINYKHDTWGKKKLHLLILKFTSITNKTINRAVALKFFEWIKPMQDSPPAILDIPRWAVFKYLTAQ